MHISHTPFPFPYSMCRHVIEECPLNDLECLNKSRVIVQNCVTFNSNKRLPESGHLEMFFGASLSSQEVKDEFILLVKDVKAPTGVTPATRYNFQLREISDNKQMVYLIKSIQGPQEIELNLIRKTFHNGVFHLSTTTNFFLFVSEL